MAKQRVPIPPSRAAEVLLANRHACCICHKFQVQIHHIDEDPSNNEAANLAVLCLEHHDLASMKGSLSRKLSAKEIREFKRQWETLCGVDINALAIDRLRYYATVYKNPPRLRELFGAVLKELRIDAANQLRDELESDDHQSRDEGYKWQMNPGKNDLTRSLIFGLRMGEYWPRVLPRVGGHPEDPDYPIDMSPPNGITAVHGYDLYCQLIGRLLAIISTPVPLEALWALRELSLIDQYVGRLVSFRERAIGKDIRSPLAADDVRIGRVQFRVQREGRVYRAFMPIKNMYVFSDTAALNLERSKVCGIGIVEDSELVSEAGKDELHIHIKPLLIGIGGYGQSAPGGFWNIDSEPVGNHDAL